MNEGLTAEELAALETELQDKAQPKVTIGFKCSPKMKEEIVTRSTRLGVTVSEFCEHGISTILKVKQAAKVEAPSTPVQPEEPIQAETQVSPVNLSNDSLELIRLEVSKAIEETNFATDNATQDALKVAKNEVQELTNQNAELQGENESLKTENEALKTSLSVFESNEKLLSLFEAFKGKPHTYENAEGEEKTVQVETLSDVLNVILDCAISSPVNEQ